MTEAQVLALINQWIVTNGNNEITADVLRPILVAILEQPNDVTGNLSDLNTTANTNLVAAINQINTALASVTNAGIKLYTGTPNPNTTPPASFNNADFYLQVDGFNAPVQLWQYNGTAWVNTEFNPSDYDLSDFNNASEDPFVHQSELPTPNKVHSATLTQINTALSPDFSFTTIDEFYESTAGQKAYIASLNLPFGERYRFVFSGDELTGMLMTFDDLQQTLIDAEITDVNDASQWNTALNADSGGDAAFTSVIVNGNSVVLQGGEDTPTYIAIIDGSGFSGLNDFSLNGEFPNLTEFQIVGGAVSDFKLQGSYPALTGVYLSNNQYTSIDLSNLTALTYIEASGTNLTYLPTANYENIISLNMELNNLSSNTLDAFLDIAIAAGWTGRTYDFSGGDNGSISSAKANAFIALGNTLTANIL